MVLLIYVVLLGKVVFLGHCVLGSPDLGLPPPWRLHKKFLMPPLEKGVEDSENKTMQTHAIRSAKTHFKHNWHAISMLLLMGFLP